MSHQMQQQQLQPIPENMRPPRFQKKQEVKDALCGSRTFYICFHFLALIMIFVYDNDLRDMIVQGDWNYPGVYFGILILSAYLFWTSGENPGYAPFEPEAIELVEHKHDEESGIRGLVGSSKSLVNLNEQYGNDNKMGIIEGKVKQSQQYLTDGGITYDSQKIKIKNSQGNPQDQGNPWSPSGLRNGVFSRQEVEEVQEEEEKKSHGDFIQTNTDSQDHNSLLHYKQYPQINEDLLDVFHDNSGSKHHEGTDVNEKNDQEMNLIKGKKQDFVIQEESKEEQAEQKIQNKLEVKQRIDGSIDEGNSTELAKIDNEQAQQSELLQQQLLYISKDNTERVDAKRDSSSIHTHRSRNNNKNNKAINPNYDEDDDDDENNEEYVIHSCRTSGTHSVRKSSSDLSQPNDDYVAELFYCSKCRRHQPFRSRHCDECDRCIHKFDHHCFWIGGCVGELNHRKFWLFLFFQTYIIFLTFKNFYDALDRFIITEKNGSESYTQEYGAFAVLCFILFIFFLFTGILCAYHTFLIMTNQTTWEHNKRSVISYTKHMPKGFYPFNQGVLKNIYMIFCHGGKIREWTVPTLKIAREKQKNTFNILENEYYNCC